MSALVELDAFVLHGQDVLNHVSARAELFGNGGPSRNLNTFDVRTDGFDIHPGDLFSIPISTTSILLARS
jgi:hypothetical protein